MAIQLRGGKELIDPIKILERGGVKQGSIVADLGCGTAGHFVFPAAHLVGEKGKVYAVDVQKSVLSAIESLRKLEGVDNVETVWSDLEQAGAMKVADASVDCVLFLNTLFQIKDKAAAMREAARIAKTGAALVIVEWEQAGAPLGPAVEVRVDKPTVKTLAQEAGFEFKEEFKAGPYHFGILFHKR